MRVGGSRGGEEGRGGEREGKRREGGGEREGKRREGGRGEGREKGMTFIS